MKKQADTIQTVGVTGNTEKELCRATVRAAVQQLCRAKRRVLCDEATGRFAGLKIPTCKDSRTLIREVDLLLVFGGDGTMLRVAREVGGSPTPILGINIGRLGFLTAVPNAELTDALKMVWSGKYWLESRALIEARGDCQGQQVRECALNDFVVGRRQVSRLIELEVWVDGVLLACYRCDGLIVSSPTGSTAYSLSAGGAVVSPTAHVFTITPICPHTLSNRSVIVSLDSEIRVKAVSPNNECVVSGDGQFLTDLSPGEEIVVHKSRRTIRLMHLANSSFFDTLRRKLGWRGAHV